MLMTVDRGERRGKQPDGWAEQTPPKEEHEYDGGRIRQRRKRPAHRGQILEAHLIHERLEQKANAYEQVDDDGAQREPVRIEGTCILVQQRPYAGDARRIQREVSVLTREPVGALGQRLVHAICPQVDRAFVRVVEITPVPVQTLQPQAKGNRRDEQQREPPPAAPQAAAYAVIGHNHCDLAHRKRPIRKGCITRLSTQRPSSVARRPPPAKSYAARKCPSTRRSPARPYATPAPSRRTKTRPVAVEATAALTLSRC